MEINVKVLGVAGICEVVESATPSICQWEAFKQEKIPFQVNMISAGPHTYSLE